jgi:uncharacterized membrane protein YiaA
MSAFADPPEGRRFAGTSIQKAALIVGIVFLVVGIAGFIPGLTVDLDELQPAGYESDALLLGLFQVSILHNALHLLFGAAGVLCAAAVRSSRVFLIAGGLVYVALWVYGLFAAGDQVANVVPVNVADNWLHLGLAVAMILLGFLVGRGSPVRAELADEANPGHH